MKALAILAALTAGPLAAEERPMTTAEFEAWSDGRTITYGLFGEAYGIERYWPDRQVTWAFRDQPCVEGHWYPDGTAICFVYDDTPEPHCWLYYRRDNGVWAESLSVEGGFYQVQDNSLPLICPGPGV